MLLNKDKEEKTKISMIKKSIHKRADFRLMDLFRFARIILVAFALVLILNSTSSMNLNEKPMEAQVFDHFIFNSISGFSLVDSNGRVHAGIIDLEKFNQETIDKSIKLEGKKGARFHLYTLDGAIDKKIYINEVEFGIGNSFSNGFFKKQNVEVVKIKTKEELVFGYLEAAYVFKNKD